MSKPSQPPSHSISIDRMPSLIELVRERRNTTILSIRLKLYTCGINALTTCQLDGWLLSHWANFLNTFQCLCFGGIIVEVVTWWLDDWVRGHWNNVFQYFSVLLILKDQSTDDLAVRQVQEALGQPFSILFNIIDFEDLLC